MSTFEVVVFAFVDDCADLVRIEVRIVLSVCNSGVLTPRPFPQLIEHSEILISLQVTLVMLDWCIDANGFESRFLPAGNNVPAVHG